MLEAIGIGFRYQHSLWLFKHLNIEINPGEVVGIYGSSGIGKSTMAKILAGYMSPQHGVIRIDGSPLASKGIHPVQLVWQHPEKVVNPRWRMKRVLLEAGRLDNDLLQELGINSKWLNRFPRELSGGELQRFCLARAIGPETKYLIADEMTTMLDAITQSQIWHSVLHIARRKNIGILAISHNPDLLRRISDRIIDFDELTNKFCMI